MKTPACAVILAGLLLAGNTLSSEGIIRNDMVWAGRPALLHCRATGKYVIIFEADNPRQWKRHKVGFAACNRIDGGYEFVDAQSPERAACLHRRSPRPTRI